MTYINNAMNITYLTINVVFVFMFAKLYWLMKNKHAYEFELQKFHLTLYFTCTLLYMITVNAVLYFAGGYLQYMYFSGPEFLTQNC